MQNSNGVVHVVQGSVVRAPRIYHAPLSITVNHGSLRSIENLIRPAVYLQSRR
jgi:hypothetical protein